MLLQGAQAAGYPTDLWTCPRVADVIRSRFGVQYHADHVGRLLHSLGWSPQKPQRRAVERDEEQVQTWIKQEWPRVKKNATLVFIDESGFLMAPWIRRSWSRHGQTPVLVQRTCSYQNVSAIAASRIPPSRDELSLF
jgi:hypothetical protein